MRNDREADHPHGLDSSSLPFLSRFRGNYKHERASQKDLSPVTQHIILKVAKELVSKSISQNATWTKSGFAGLFFFSIGTFIMMGHLYFHTIIDLFLKDLFLHPIAGKRTEKEGIQN